MPVEAKESIRSHGIGVRDGCGLCEFWELNPGNLEEQPVVLTTEPVLQPPPFKVIFLLRVWSSRIGVTQ